MIEFNGQDSPAFDEVMKILKNYLVLNNIVDYEMIRCDGHWMKKERRKCIS